MKKQGMLIVVSGFSGVGKGTAVKQLIKKPGYSLSISATTRQPRPGEEHGREYFFKTVEEFESLIAEDGFIEHARYVDNYYGTPRAFVEQQLEEGNNVILEIEVKGALQIKEQYPNALLIFISAASAEELKLRLTDRGTETQEVIDQRMKRAAEEALSIKDYDYFVINRDGQLEQCVEEIHSIVTANKLVRSYWYKEIDAIQNELVQL